MTTPFLIADAAEVAIMSPLAEAAFGSYDLQVPEGIDIEDIHDFEAPGNELGYVARLSPSRATGIARRFIRADVSVVAKDDTDPDVIPESDVDRVLSEAESRVESEFFLESDITKAGLGSWVPYVDFNVGDIVNVRIFDIWVSLPVTRIEPIISDGDVVDWRVHVGGQLLSDDQAREVENATIQKELIQDRRDLAGIDAKATKAVKDSGEANSKADSALDAVNDADGVIQGHVKSAREYSEESFEHSQQSYVHSEASREHSASSLLHSQNSLTHSQESFGHAEDAVNAAVLAGQHSDKSLEHSEASQQSSADSHAYSELSRQHSDSAFDYSEASKTHSEAAAAASSKAEAASQTVQNLQPQIQDLADAASAASSESSQHSANAKSYSEASSGYSQAATAAKDLSLGALRDAELARDAAETSRRDAEAKRDEAEQARKGSFNSMVAASSSMNMAERSRAAAERARAEAESARALAEGDRQRAESARNLAEGYRDDAESKRAAAESERALAEGYRKGSFNSMIAASNSMSMAERSRAAAEADRAAAEASRALAESERQAAETAREQAETARANAFESREAAMTAYMDTQDLIEEEQNELIAQIAQQQKDLAESNKGRVNVLQATKAGTTWPGIAIEAGSNPGTTWGFRLPDSRGALAHAEHFRRASGSSYGITKYKENLLTPVSGGWFIDCEEEEYVRVTWGGVAASQVSIDKSQSAITPSQSTWTQLASLTQTANSRATNGYLSLRVTWSAANRGSNYTIRILADGQEIARKSSSSLGPLTFMGTGVRSQNLTVSNVTLAAGKSVTVQAYCTAGSSSQRRIGSAALKGTWIETT